MRCRVLAPLQDAPRGVSATRRDAAMRATTFGRLPRWAINKAARTEPSEPPPVLTSAQRDACLDATRELAVLVAAHALPRGWWVEWRWAPEIVIVVAMGPGGRSSWRLARTVIVNDQE